MMKTFIRLLKNGRFLLIGLFVLIIGYGIFYSDDEAIIKAHESGDYDSDIDEAIKAHESGDYAKAVKLYRKAAEQGDAKAQNNLGVMYYNGVGVPQDYVEAAKWYRQAAEQGDALSQYNLGFMYITGQGVPQDLVVAYMWYNTAAASGDEDSIEIRDEVANALSRAKLAEGQKLAQECVAKNYKDC